MGEGSQSEIEPKRGERQPPVEGAPISEQSEYQNRLDELREKHFRTDIAPPIPQVKSKDRNKNVKKKEARWDTHLEAHAAQSMLSLLEIVRTSERADVDEFITSLRKTRDKAVKQQVKLLLQFVAMGQDNLQMAWDSIQDKSIGSSDGVYDAFVGQLKQVMEKNQQDVTTKGRQRIKKSKWDK